MKKIELDYYKKVIETQNDHQILKSELSDLVAEVEEFFRNKGKCMNNKEVVKLIDSWLEDKTGYDEKTWPEIKKEMVLNCMECVPGCISYDGGEKKHHKDCPYYSESFTKRYDDLKKIVEETTS